VTEVVIHGRYFAAPEPDTEHGFTIWELLPGGGIESVSQRGGFPSWESALAAARRQLPPNGIGSREERAKWATLRGGRDAQKGSEPR